MTVEFRDSGESLSAALAKTARSISGETVTLRQLFELIGEQGLLLLCAFLTIPFLIPVSIPVSTVFGAAIILISIGVIFNRVPWIPGGLMNRPIATENLIPTLEKGARFVGRFDRFVHPRLTSLTDGAVINRINGVMLLIGGVMLIFPLGLIPFSNTLPALAILFLAIGILQRDGLFILLGYLMNILTVIYFAVLALGAIAAGQGIRSLLGSIAPLILR